MFEKACDLDDPSSDEGDLEEEEEEEEEGQAEEEEEDGEEDEEETGNDDVEEDEESEEADKEQKNEHNGGKKLPETKEKSSNVQSKKTADMKKVNGNDNKIATKNMIAGADVKKTVKRPPTAAIVEEAITFLKEKKGSSLQAIQKFAKSNYADISEIHLKRSLKKYLPTAVANGILIQTSGKGAAGSFKLSAELIKKNASQAKALKKKEKEKLKVKQKDNEKKEKVKLKEKAKKLKQNTKKIKPNVDKTDAAKTETAVKEKTTMKKKVQAAGEEKMKKVATKGSIQPARKSITIPARALKQPKPKIALKSLNKKAKNATAAVETVKITRQNAKT